MSWHDEEAFADPELDDQAVESVAVIGMAGIFPGARSPAQLWEHLRAGRDLTRRFTDEELLGAGIERQTLDDPDYVAVSAVIDDADAWDAEFYGFSPREAEILDPQHRIFLDCVWHALEDAGCDPERFEGPIGLYAGCFMNKYLASHLQKNAAFLRSPLAFFARVFNDKDFLATRASYLFNLRGPAMTVQTACSTSLVATHLAVTSLLNHECDVALAGGVAINVPLFSGYPVIDGGLFTPEGRCRPFDHRAAGTVPGYGAGVVVLRRLSEALDNGDHVRAVIRATAVNNDGSAKVGFSAPSVDAQGQVVEAAQALAGVEARSIGYIEAHGTGTQVGDPIEVAGLTAAFRHTTDDRGFCALGSAKANIGHLDAAAGVASLIKTVLVLEHGVIPPCANFEHPNPKLELADSPFYVPEEAVEWRRGATPRRAGVSSLGIGGTNAHAVLEEAPAPKPAGEPRPYQVLVLSARTESALDAAAERLAQRLGAHPELTLSDVAWTLQTGRREFEWRRTVVARDTAHASTALRAPRLSSSRAEATRRPVVFLFGGGGTQYRDMALELYRGEDLFRREVDRAAEILRPRLDLDLRHFLYPTLHPAGAEMAETAPRVLAALVATQFALARLWMSWGVLPQAMIGHSMGEYLAGCLAGVFTFEELLALAVRRGELFEAVPPGAMMIVQLGEDEARSWFGEELSVAAVNAPRVTVVSGPRAAVRALEKRLDQADVEWKPVHIAVASHSSMMEPMLDELREFVAGLSLREPRIPFISNVTGTWIKPEEATDPAYWARHLRRTVRFSDGVRELLGETDRVLLEVGPGNALSTLAGMQGIRPAPVALSTLRHPQDPQSDYAFLLDTVGRLWRAGVEIDWPSLRATEAPRRVPLPGYPFERRRHWIAPDTLAPAAAVGERPALVPGARTSDVAAASVDRSTADDPVAPRNEREEQLAGIWRELLGVELIGVHDDFFALGGHSLMATQMMKRLRRDFEFKLDLRVLFEAPTIAQLAAVMAAGGTAGALGTGIDLEAEVRLDPAIQAGDLSLPAESPPSVVLLTGATGFLGAYLCRDLLRRTNAEVVCLVRAEDAAAGQERIRRNLEAYAIDEPIEGRITALPGDLSQPLLGLTEAEFGALAARVDLVYHCGAWVNFARPYRSLRATNVGGTEEILRLATAERLKPVHHVSTLAVLAGAVARGDDEVFEDDPLPPPAGHDTGYSQSKWVAERVLGLARERGVPVAVYRPSLVLGDSATGIVNEDDYLTKMIQGCVQLGLAPRRDYPLTAAPVDQVSAAIVELSLDPASLGRNYHVIHRDTLPWDRIFEYARAYGFAVASVPYEEWKEELSHRIASSPAGDNALEPLVALLADDADRRMPRFDCSRLTAGLKDKPVRSVSLDGELFAAYFAYFIHRGWLPAVDMGELQETR